MQLTEELLEKIGGVVLEDDDTPTGGVSISGETVKDFVEEFDGFSTLEELNEALEECGILPIKVE